MHASFFSTASLDSPFDSPFSVSADTSSDTVHLPVVWGPGLLLAKSIVIDTNKPLTYIVRSSSCKKKIERSISLVHAADLRPQLIRFHPSAQNFAHAHKSDFAKTETCACDSCCRSSAAIFSSPLPAIRATVKVVDEEVTASVQPRWQQKRHFWYRSLSVGRGRWRGRVIYRG